MAMMMTMMMITIAHHADEYCWRLSFKHKFIIIYVLHTNIKIFRTHTHTVELKEKKLRAHSTSESKHNTLLHSIIFIMYKHTHTLRSVYTLQNFNQEKKIKWYILLRERCSTTTTTSTMIINWKRKFARAMILALHTMQCDDAGHLHTFIYYYFIYNKQYTHE